MTEKKIPAPGTSQICFGLNRSLDEASLKAFLEAFSNEELIQTLLPRMETKEIDETVDFLTGLMKRHLSEKEYHQLFLDWSNRQQTNE